MATNLIWLEKYPISSQWSFFFVSEAAFPESFLSLLATGLSYAAGLTEIAGIGVSSSLPGFPVDCWAILES
jgi:hypothetical protein